MCFFRLPGQNSTAAWQTAALPTDRDDWHSAETASHKDSAHTKPANRCCTTGHWFHGQSPENQTQWHKTNQMCHSLQTALQRNNRSSAGSVFFAKSYPRPVLPFDSGKVHSQGKIRTYQFRKNSLFGKGTLFLVSPHIFPEDHTQQQIDISGFLL